MITGVGFSVITINSLSVLELRNLRTDYRIVRYLRLESRKSDTSYTRIQKK